MDKIWSWLEHNRYTVIGPVVGILIWAYAVSCTPLTISPLDPGRMVNVTQLDLDFKTWQAEQQIMAAKFEVAGKDLTEQKENNEKIKETILGLASGGIPDMPGLVKLVLGGGGMGLAIESIRKSGVIGGLKRNKEPA